MILIRERNQPNLLLKSIDLKQTTESMCLCACFYTERGWHSHNQLCDLPVAISPSSFSRTTNIRQEFSYLCSVVCAVNYLTGCLATHEEARYAYVVCCGPHGVSEITDVPSFNIAPPTPTKWYCIKNYVAVVWRLMKISTRSHAIGFGGAHELCSFLGREKLAQGGYPVAIPARGNVCFRSSACRGNRSHSRRPYQSCHRVAGIYT